MKIQLNIVVEVKDKDFLHGTKDFRLVEKSIVEDIQSAMWDEFGKPYCKLTITSLAKPLKCDNCKQPIDVTTARNIKNTVRCPKCSHDNTL